MTTRDHQDLRRLANEATPGPWEAIDLGGSSNIMVADAGDTILSVHRRTRPRKHEQNTAAFIAAANPTTVLALLDEIEALRKGLGNIAKQIGTAIGAGTVYLGPYVTEPHTREMSRDHLMVGVREIARTLLSSETPNE